ncbi:MAG: BTAD domain-containing putative transcriptional regulator [Actinomycetota bacterium]
MQFRVLGPLEVDAGDGPIPLGGPKQRAVLANLLVRANQLVPADTLIGEIWGEEPPERARHTLQTYVSNLRRALGDERLQGRSPGYILLVDPFDLDAARFDSLVRDAKEALLVAPTVAVATLDDALALWRGPALADLADRSSLLAEAARLDDLRLEAQESRIEGLLASGAQAGAIGELESLLATNPLREGLWGQLMTALYREGRQAEALGAYQRAREILADELGIDPSPELTRLHERVLKQDPGLDLRGEPLRGYRLLERIEDGPTGTVFRAIQPHVGRDVAVKVIHEHIASDPSLVARFEAEAQAVAALEHPHIVPIHDYWREPGRAYIVSRYLRGGSLRGVEERDGSLPRDRAVRAVEQIASALAFAHRHGIAHGNLGTSNVLFDAEGNAYLADFRIGIGPVPEPPDDVRALAGFASDLLPPDASGPLQELVDRVDAGPDVPPAATFVEAARSSLEPDTSAALEPRDVRNPYKGLRAFTSADARDFFGRGELTERLVARLNESGSAGRFLAVVGPSGSGKSSVVRAGLIPAIRGGALGEAGACSIAEMFPGPHPVDEMAAALLRIAVRPTPRLHDLVDSGTRGLLDAVELVAPEGSEVVLVIDQFEELFTLTTTNEHERELFLESLRVATADPRSRVRVIVTLRADFYDRPLVYPRFGELLASRTEAVPPMTPDELEQAIRAPAEQEGVRPEPGLVAEMVADVAHQPGALPLLQYALTELFERRDRDRLIVDAYREIGGVAGALSARAERSYEATDADGRRAIRQVFLRLVTLGEGRQDTRRRVARGELDDLDLDPAQVDAVLETFGHHRLLTFDREPSTREPTVEIAHEALIGAWSRMRGWIDAARDDLRQERRLSRAGAEWRGADEDPSFLLRGARLEQSETWAEGTDLAIGRHERAYLKASVDERDRERAAERERKDHERHVERRARTRLRALVAVFAVAALIAGALTIIATAQGERAGREASVAKARELAAASVANLDSDPERSILLAIEAVDRTRSVDGTVLPEAEDALHQAVTASRIVRSFPGSGGSVDWGASSDFVTSRGLFQRGEDNESVSIRDIFTGDSVLTLSGHGAFINDAAFSPDGSRLATAGDDGTLKVWDASSGDLVAARSGGANAWAPSFNEDGSVVATLFSPAGSALGTVGVLDLDNGRIRTYGSLPDFPNDVSLSPDGTKVAVASGGIPGVIAVIDLESRKVLELRGKGDWGFTSVSWSPDGRYLAAGGWDPTVSVWVAATGDLRYTLVGHTQSAMWVDWSPDSSRLVTGSDDTTAKVWAIREDGYHELTTLATQEGEISGVTFSPDGEQVMTGTEESAARIWDVHPTGDAEWTNVPITVGDVEFVHDNRLMTSGRDGSPIVVDLGTGRQRSIASFNRPERRPVEMDIFHPTDISPDGTAMAIRYADGSVVVRDIPSGEVLFDVATPVRAAGWSPDGQYLAAATRDRGSISIFDRSGSEADVLRQEFGNIRAVQFSPDGRMIATLARSGSDYRVTMLDRERGLAVRTMSVTGPGTGWELIAFDPGGTRVATGGHEIWDARSGALITRFPDPPVEVFGMAFSSDGSRLAVASTTKVHLFDTETGQEAFALTSHRAIIVSLAFSPDGSMLASRDDRGLVRVWAVDIDDLLAIARREVTRELTTDECRQFLHLDRCPAT